MLAVKSISSKGERVERVHRDQDYLQALEVHKQVYRDGVESPESVLCSFTSSLPGSPSGPASKYMRFSEEAVVAVIRRGPEPYNSTLDKCRAEVSLRELGKPALQEAIRAAYPQVETAEHRELFQSRDGAPRKVLVVKMVYYKGGQGGGTPVPKGSTVFSNRQVSSTFDGRFIGGRQNGGSALRGASRMEVVQSPGDLLAAPTDNIQHVFVLDLLTALVYTHSR